VVTSARNDTSYDTSYDTSAELEGNILKLLSDASGDILEDEVLIQTLSQVPRIHASRSQSQI
jgi:hypothetical protein